MASIVADNPKQSTTSLTAPEYGSTFLKIDDDTDSDREFKLGRLGHGHP